MTIFNQWVLWGCSWGLSERSWAALSASGRGIGPLSGPHFSLVGDLGPLLAPLHAVLGSSCDLCERSWGGVGGLDNFWSIWGRSWLLRESLKTVLGRCGRSWHATGLKNGSGSLTPPHLPSSLHINALLYLCHPPPTHEKGPNRYPRLPVGNGDSER